MVAWKRWSLGLAGPAIDAAVTATARPDGEMIAIGGQSLHIVRRPGPGPSVLLVHGLLGCTRNFYRLVDRLDPEWDVTLVDRPGCGFSPPAAAGAAGGLAGQARLMAELVRALDLDRPVVVGHSMGGAIALRLGQDNPDAIGAVAALAPATHQLKGRLPNTVGAVMGGALANEAAALMVGVPLMATMGLPFATLAFWPEPVAPSFFTGGGGVLSMRASALRTGMRDLGTLRRELPAAGEGGYHRFAVPVHVLGAASDQLAPPRDHGEILAAERPEVSLRTIAGGHMIPVTQPDTVAAWIAQAVASRAV